ncbi:hypothetical protein OG478_52575 [Streptomyces phaeochromogenes]|uniref:hypothetical protein n=1 Tax=Streptomyces phaeochromogenes TaxID=1923 RepID=UPI0038695F31|nr:hypothetical protein OG478_00165 [Streptomyces phaeochromogenes]WSS99670.1 hypothetical protein OG478_52575 [Streptomyces phaeochromogenes]
MADWQARRIIGDQHEHTVKNALEARGWTVHSCGQGTYPAPIQQALRHTPSPLRYFPDLIAARGSELVTIDAKTRMPSTASRNYAISHKCALAGLQFMGVHAPVPLYYVLGDLRVLTPAEVLYDAFHTLRPTHGAYHLVNSRRALPFDEVFGTGSVQERAA